MLKKLLTHRLREFDSVEHTLTGMKEACKLAIPYIEIDTRVSADGIIYVYHDAHIRIDGNKKKFCNLQSDELKEFSYENGEPILHLIDALDEFKSRAYSDQKFCIDMKDYGFEEQHLSLVRQAGVLENVCFVSWIPQTITRMHELCPTVPCILSHWNVHKWGWFGSVIHSFFNNRLWGIKEFALLGHNRAVQDLGRYKHGYQHGFFCKKLPASIETALRESKGGICVHTSMVGDKLFGYCREKGLQIWVFSVTGAEDYAKYSNMEGVDVVFCDNAPQVFNQLIKE